MMKKLVFLCFFASALFLFSACKKKYTCTCTDQDGNITNVSHYHLTPRDAESACNNKNDEDPDITCVLTED